MIREIINRYKRLRTERLLAQTYQYSYAFVGMGQHSLTNLYPVLHYLGVPLKYICVTSERKARLIERKFPNVKATTSLDTILNDDKVKGVFVSASPSAHFSIALRVLKSGKSLFIEKPPCQTLAELDTLIQLHQLYRPSIAMVGLQKRYAPAVQILHQRLHKDLGVPYEKIRTHNRTVEYLYSRNNSAPTLPNNQIYSQGYYNEIQAFLASVEHGHSGIISDITTVRPTYEVLMSIS